MYCKINEMFHVARRRVVKTSNNEPVPEDEPLFVLRGRDCLATSTLEHYVRRCEEMGVPQDRLDALWGVMRQFQRYAIEKSTKVPGSTHGK